VADKSRKVRKAVRKAELRRAHLAALELGISHAMVRKFLDRRQIRRFKLNSLTYVDMNELRALIQPQA